MRQFYQLAINGLVAVTLLSGCGSQPQSSQSGSPTMSSVCYDYFGNTAVFAMNQKNQVVEFNKGQSVNLGFSARQISASDDYGQPEVFAIQNLPLRSDGEVYANNGNGWIDMHEDAIQISADGGGCLYAINPDNSVSYFDGKSWSNLGNSMIQISACNGCVYGIGFDSRVYAEDTYNGPHIWKFTGVTMATQISAVNGRCFAIGQYNSAASTNVYKITENAGSFSSTPVSAYFSVNAVAISASMGGPHNGEPYGMYWLDGKSNLFCENSVWVDGASAGGAVEISSPSDQLGGGLRDRIVYGITQSGDLIEDQGGQGWTNLGGGFESSPTRIVPHIHSPGPPYHPIH